jgi:hypothetical protein
MKKNILITGTMLLLASMFVSIGIASATPIHPDLQTKANGVLWIVPTDINLDGAPDFDTKLLIEDTLVATVFTQTDPVEVIPINIAVKENYIMLVFQPKSLPDAPVTILVTADLIGGDTLYATGPGYTYRIK